MAGAHIPVPIDAEAVVRTGGGGGWGDPLTRDPALVADDVAEGLISAAAARKLYGVVLRGNLSLDEAGTKRLRERLRSMAKARPRTKAAKSTKRRAKGRKR
jgi:N-methylhydantoinase B